MLRGKGCTGGEYKMTLANLTDVALSCNIEKTIIEPMGRINKKND
jgi:hypothetical protein